MRAVEVVERSEERRGVVAQAVAVREVQAVEIMQAQQARLILAVVQAVISIRLLMLMDQQAAPASSS